jgi:diguanylate cyclase (GGDEF)-like protein
MMPSKMPVPLERNAGYSAILNRLLETLVSSIGEETVDNVMSKGMQLVADTISLDRIIVYRIFDRGGENAGEVFRWDKDRGGTVLVDEALSTLPITATIKRWVSIASKDECIKLRRSELSGDEAAFLVPRGVKSMLIAPVFIDGYFWGAVTFHDNTAERDFDEDCTAILRSVGRLCASAIVKEEKAIRATESLKQREKLWSVLDSALAKITKSPTLSSGNLKEAADLIAKEGCRALEAHRVGIWRTADRTFAESHPVLSGRRMKASRDTDTVESLKNVTFYDIETNRHFVAGDFDLSKWPHYVSLLLSERLIVINDVTEPSPLQGVAEVIGLDLCSLMDAPIRINGKLAGVVCIEQLRCEEFPNLRHWTAEEQNFASSLADFMAIAFESAERHAIKRHADERVRLMFNSMPFGCVYWNDKAAPIDCNDGALRLFGVSSKQELIDNFFDFSPDLQPDGSPSTDKAYRLIFYALRHGKAVFEWMHKKHNGDPLPTEITIIKVAHGSEHIAVSYMRDLTEIKLKSAELNSARELAFTDSLTGIPNRRFFMEYVNNEFSSQENIAATMGIILFDIDHFKRINDTFGHDCGDEALKMVVARAQSVLRESDVMARLGGEEFIILVHNLELNNLVSLAKRILSRIKSMEFIYNGEKIPVTVSAGVAVRENILQPHMHIIKQADVALYRAKTNGRNRVGILDD